MTTASIIHVLIALAAAPLLPGIINRVKAKFAGRRGQPVLQLYIDIWKLLHKGAVYSRTTTWVFRAGPVVGLAAVLTALAVAPLGGVAGLIQFPGDMLLLAGLLGLMRLATVLAALDTGSAFEGMGASREVTFSALAEPALLLALAALARQTSQASLSGIFASIDLNLIVGRGGLVALLAGGTLLIVLLTENSRIPVDDPNTHLELTMIHEVMVLDHGGVDLGLIHYASSLKLWVLGALLGGIICPHRLSPWASLAGGLAALVLLAVIVGVIESVMARLRLTRVPQMLSAAAVMAMLALVLSSFLGSTGGRA